ncbi:hypothetical protein pb186bvf_011408 [Paramecium bursaria]
MQAILFITLCLFYLGISFSLKGSIFCDPTEIQQEQDCQIFFNWSTTLDGRKKCIQQNCTLLNQTWCQIRSVACAWYNNSCVSFTNCSDYNVTNSSDCTYMGPGCKANSTVNGQTKCADYVLPYINCTLYNSTTCTYTRTRGACFNSTSGCKATTCSDQTNQTDCTFVYSGNLSNPYLCQWNGNSCTNATGTTILNSQNCYNNTIGTYKWVIDGGRCSPCLGISDQNWDLRQIVTVQNL